MNDARAEQASDGAKYAIVVSGGDPPTTIKGSMECFDLATQTWASMSIPDMPSARCAHTSVAIDDVLYVLGGVEPGMESTNTISVYDQRQNVWTDGPPMKSKRRWHAAVVLDKNIYVIGGHQNGHPLDSVELFQSQTKRWSSRQSMLTARCDFSATVCQGKIYVAGGLVGKRLSSAEVYNPENNNWTQLPPMSTGRCGLCLCAIGDQIYAVGGYTDYGKYLASAEVYSVGTNSWSSIASMNTPRGWFGLVVHGGNMYAVGGETTGDLKLSSIERYAPSSNQWTKLPCEMKQGRNWFGIAVLKINPT